MVLNKPIVEVAEIRQNLCHLCLARYNCSVKLASQQLLQDKASKQANIKTIDQSVNQSINQSINQ